MSLHSGELAIVGASPKRLLIDGVWREGLGGQRVAVEDPSTGETLCEVASATPADGLAALDAAVAAQVAWGRHPPQERARILQRAFDELTERAEEIALLLTLEMGKPLPESLDEVRYAADYLAWFAEETVRI